MGILTAEMRRVVEAELGFIATVCPDGISIQSHLERLRATTAG